MLFTHNIIALYFSLKLKLLKTVDRLKPICYFVKEGSNVWILGSRKGGVPCTDNLPPYRLRKRTIRRRIAGVVPTLLDMCVCLFLFFAERRYLHERLNLRYKVPPKPNFRNVARRESSWSLLFYIR